MYRIDYDHPVAVHFIGIGGISMSGLAEILLDRGFTVSGSDNTLSPLTERLEKKGARILTPQAAANVSGDLDLVVYTAAIHPDNPEFDACVRLGLPMLTRAQLLGQIMAHYHDSVAVAGTHGKTTTTGMIGEILLHCDEDPTISIGGIYPAIDGNIHVGSSERFVTEACEYTNSFHEFFPRYNVILNIEEDHMDFFKDLADIRRSFRRFAENTHPDGVLIINRAIDNLDELTDELPCRVVTFGNVPASDYFPADITHHSDGRTTFNAMRKGEDGTYHPLVTITLFVPGEHNILNALAAAALAHEMGLPMDSAADALAAFRGTERRFEYKGVFQGAAVYDDYAHHPTEIAASLAAARTLPHKRLILVFQPHTYTRTKAFLQAFADVLCEADVLILAKIYAAREDDIYGVSSADIKRLVDAKDLPTADGLERCYYMDDFGAIEEFLKKISSTGDLLITMGAGNVVNIADDLVTP